MLGLGPRSRVEGRRRGAILYDVIAPRATIMESQRGFTLVLFDKIVIDPGSRDWRVTS